MMNIYIFFSIASQLISPLQATGPCRTIRDKYDRAAMMSRNVIADTKFRWPDATVPYIFGSKFTASEMEIIKQSMANIENHSGVHFVPRCEHHNNFVNITNDDRGCYVIGLGYNARRGAQKMNLMRNGCVWLSVVVHEFLHVLGFMHEQNRPDRDQYITVEWDNIEFSINKYAQFVRAKFPGETIPTCDFSRIRAFDDCYNGDTATTYGLPYDYQSVMHYGSTAFSKNGQATLVGKNYFGPMGSLPTSGLTALDIQKLNKTYPDFPVRKVSTDCSTVPNESCISNSGDPCIFPFNYNGVKYEKCTTVDYGTMPWCAVKSLTDTGDADAYSSCPSNCPVYPEGEPTVQPTECEATNGKKCVFPFTYKQSQFDKCTTIDNNGVPWCATGVNSQTNQYTTYGTCKSSCEVMPTVDPSTCQTTSGMKCVFPFDYLGVQYNSCTDVDFNGQFWCATSTTMGAYDGNYGLCGKGC